MQSKDFEGFDLNEINDVLNETFRDTETKEIGDRVNVIDFSSCTNLKGRRIDFKNIDDIDFNTKFIVIETRQNITYDVEYTVFNQNLVIVDPLSNMKYRINSGHIKLLK